MTSPVMCAIDLNRAAEEMDFSAFMQLVALLRHEHAIAALSVIFADDDLRHAARELVEADRITAPAMAEVARLVIGKVFHDARWDEEKGRSPDATANALEFALRRASIAAENRLTRLAEQMVEAVEGLA